MDIIKTTIIANDDGISELTLSVTNSDLIAYARNDDLYDGYSDEEIDTFDIATALFDEMESAACSDFRETHMISDEGICDTEYGWQNVFILTPRTKPYLSGADILDIPMGDDNDAGAGTIREYLVALARVVWDQGEGMSGKRPFGNSGWEYDLKDALAAAGHFGGVWEVDEDGYGEIREDETYDDSEFRPMIDRALDALMAG